MCQNDYVVFTSTRNNVFFLYVPYSGKVWQGGKFGELTLRAFGERKFGKLIDQPIDF